jgi:hypothetical protein
MAPDILADQKRSSGGIEEPGCVQAAGALEPRLGEAVGQAREKLA